MKTDPDSTPIPFAPGLSLAIDAPSIEGDALIRAIRAATKNIHTAPEWLAVEEQLRAMIFQGNPIAPGCSIRMNPTQTPVADVLGQRRAPGRHRVA